MGHGIPNGSEIYYSFWPSSPQFSFFFVCRLMPNQIESIIRNANDAVIKMSFKWLSISIRDGQWNNWAVFAFIFAYFNHSLCQSNHEPSSHFNACRFAFPFPFEYYESIYLWMKPIILSIMLCLRLAENHNQIITIRFVNHNFGAERFNIIIIHLWLNNNDKPPHRIERHTFTSHRIASASARW